MSLAAYNFNAAKDDLVDYLNSATAANLHALSPRPTAFDCENPLMEDIVQAPEGGVIGVDDVSATQDRARASGNNLHQTATINFDLYVSSSGNGTRASARDAVRTIASALIEDLTGSGAFVGTDRSRVYSAVWSGWAWAPATNDSLIADMTVSVVLTIYRSP